MSRGSEPSISSAQIRMRFGDRKADTVGGDLISGEALLAAPIPSRGLPESLPPPFMSASVTADFRSRDRLLNEASALGAMLNALRTS